MAIESARAFAVAFLNSLGIDSQFVIAVQVDLRAGAIPSVTVTRALPQGAGKAAAEVVERFHMVAAPASKPRVTGALDVSAPLATGYEVSHTGQSDNGQLADPTATAER